MLSSSLSDYRDAYALVSATIPVPNTAAAEAAANNKKIYKFKIVLHLLIA